MIDRYCPFDWEAAQMQVGMVQATRQGNLLHVAGTASLDGDFAPLHVGDFNAQLECVYRRIGETLAHYGLGFPDVVREVMYTTDFDALMAAVPLRRAFYVGEKFPASTGIEVRRLMHPDLLIEVQVDAAFPSG